MGKASAAQCVTRDPLPVLCFAAAADDDVDDLRGVPPAPCGTARVLFGAT